MSRRTTVPGLLLALVLALVAVTPAAAAPTRLDLDLQRTALPGSRVTLGASLAGPGDAARPVEVQQRRDGRWVTVLRQRYEPLSGLSVVLRAPRRLGPVDYRVVAPRARGRAAVVSPVRTLRVVRQRLAWSLPRTVEVGTEVRSPAALRPRVRGVAPVLEQRVNGRWAFVARARRGAFRYVHTTSGPSRFRVRVDADRTAYRSLTGTPSDVVLPTRRVSTTSNGSQLDGPSDQASASDDGRHVAFVTTAPDAVPGDDNGVADVVVKDTATGRLTLVSRGPQRRPGDGASSAPAVSGDGSVVVFVSRATDLVPGDGDRRPDVFAWEGATGAVTRVGRDAAEPDVSRDGRTVVFASGGRVLLRDRATGALTVVSAGPRSRQPVVSADGAHVAWTSPAGVHLWDRATGTSRLLAAGGSSPRLDADASVVAWAADGQVLRRDLATGTTTQVPAGDAETGAAPARPAALSADGSVLLFSSAAPLVADDVDAEQCESEGDCSYYENLTDAYVWDVATGTVTMASRSATGAPSDHEAVGQDLTADGRTAVLASRSVLVPGQRDRGDDRGGDRDVHDVTEVFVRDLS